MKSPIKTIISALKDKFSTYEIENIEVVQYTQYDWCDSVKDMQIVTIVQKFRTEVVRRHVVFIPRLNESYTMMYEDGTDAAVELKRAFNDYLVKKHEEDHLLRKQSKIKSALEKKNASNKTAVPT